MEDAKKYFDRCVVISLKRTPQRLESFWQRIDACNWPFIRPIVYDAIDGKLCPLAPWAHFGPGAWGAMRSHLNVIESALNDGIQRLLVMEDDAAPCEQFAEKVIAFLDALPSNAEICYIGGQVTHKHQQLRKINDLVINPESVNRLHCYFLTRPGMTKVYQHLCRWGWYQGEQDGNGRWKGPHHVDHRIEILSENRQLATYAPAQWLVEQAPGYSEIMERHLPDRDFTGHPKKPAVVAVLGPYRGGTSAVAGAMHNMGILMGHKFFTQAASPKGCFEAMMLYRLCLACYSEPDFQEQADYSQRVDLLRRWAEGRWNNMDRGMAVIGAKHPKLCLMIPEMCEAWPDCKFIVVHRDPQHSIDSLRKLGWWRNSVPPDALVNRLIQARDNHLQGVPAERQLHVQYEDLLHNTESCLKLIAKFAGVEPTPAHYEKAINFLDRGLNHHNGQPTCDCKEPCGAGCGCR